MASNTAAKQKAVAHLARRAGFGATPQELAAYTRLGYSATVSRFVHFEGAGLEVDALIGRPNYAPVLPADQMAGFAPNYRLSHARARWLFRMIYTKRPLREKMALFWHNHFATGWSKIAADINDLEATRLMAAVPSQDKAGQRGQIEMFRRYGMGYFGDLLLAVSQDPAMLYWLDGRLNRKGTPQENYAREVMELFTMGVGHFTEDDVKAAARVFTGWNLNTVAAGTLPFGSDNPRIYKYSFLYEPTRHDTDPKVFSFPIYTRGAAVNVIPARPAALGLRDGLDFLAALLRHPATADRLATKLYRFFVNDVDDPPAANVAQIATWLQKTRFNMRTVMAKIFASPFFKEEANEFACSRWPVGHVVGTIKSVGFSPERPLSRAVQTLSNLGEDLYDPPSVEGYKAGLTWLNPSTMLTRANFVVDLANRRRDALADEIVAKGAPTPDALIDHCLQRLGPITVEPAVRDQLLAFVTSGSGTPWTGSRDQLVRKVPGLIHLIAGTGEYAFV
jgi:uncharacterized protein (DUF1800 family)